MDPDAESFDTHVQELMKKAFMYNITIRPHMIPDSMGGYFFTGYEAQFKFRMHSIFTQESTIG